jgi:hypothetical protein
MELDRPSIPCHDSIIVLLSPTILKRPSDAVQSRHEVGYSGGPSVQGSPKNGRAFTRLAERAPLGFAPPMRPMVGRRRSDHRYESEVQGSGQLRALPQGGAPLRRQRPCRRQRDPDVPRSGFRGHRDRRHRARHRQ